jgi:hypothetical protein
VVAARSSSLLSLFASLELELPDESVSKSITRPETPPDAWWIHVTDELLTSPDGAELRQLAESFEPTVHDDGHQMASWLRDAVARQSLPTDTYALRTDNELLGFFAVEPALVKFSHRALPIIELYKRITQRGPQQALLLSSIARAASTPPRFGHVLFEHAIGVALSDSQNVAILVQPMNQRVSTLWKEEYSFRPMDAIDMPGLLYFPLGEPPELKWP